MKYKIFIRTLGCQMNARDSEFVMGMLLDRGFTRADSMDDADIVLFNSCSVRKHAEDRLFSNIADLKNLKKKKGIIIGLIGCTAQNYKGDVLKYVPMVDLVCGPGNEADLPVVLNDILKNGCTVVATNKVNEKRPELFPKYREHPFKSYVSISEGCDNFCSYCIVPYVRGRERSRDSADIIKEVQDLADRGCKEITLLGQNVNSYGKGKGDRVKGNGFVGLLRDLSNIKGIERIRFMTSHPKDASEDLFRAIRDLDKVCGHLHLPAQSGSDRILRLMNRGYTSKKYLKLIEEYRKYLPEGSITTDIIVGFPSETKKDFDATLNLIKNVKFDSAYTFKYSPRPPAKASRLKDSVSDKVKTDRITTLISLQCEISRLRNTAMIGRVVEVLVDGCDDRGGELLSGRTRENKVTVFNGKRSMIGNFIKVKIESTTPHTLKGKVIK